MVNLKKIILYSLAFIFLLFGVKISGMVERYGGGFLDDDRRLLYMYRSEYKADETNKAILIKSYKQLKSYYETNKIKYDFDSDRKQDYYELKNFGEIINNYNDEFFEKSDLVIFVTTEESDNYYYRLDSIEYWFSKIEIALYRDLPRQNADFKKVTWHTLLEIDKKALFFSAEVKITDISQR